jgi:hypothetical protein
MLLYHYSNVDLDTIDPKKFGSSHTPHSETPRSYYYVDKSHREKFFRGARYRYTVNLQNTLIYDVHFDKFGWFSKLNEERLIKKLVEHGYQGFSFKDHTGAIIIALLYAQKPIKKEVLY